MYRAEHISLINRIIKNAVLQATNTSSLEDITKEHFNTIKHVFSCFNKMPKIALCSEWGVKPEWVEADLTTKHPIGDHIHEPILNPFGFQCNGVIIFGGHLHVDNEIIGLCNYSLAIENIAIGLANNNIDLVTMQCVDKVWEKIVEAIMNNNFTMFGIEQDTVVDRQGIKMALESTKAIEDPISRGYNPQRLNKYDKDLASASVKDLMGAFGESLDEVLNRRDIRPEEQITREFLGISPAEMSAGDKVFPAFYIPLALMGMDAILNDKFDVVKTLNFDWSSKISPVGYAMYEVGCNKEKRLMTEAHRFCKRRQDDAKMVMVTEIKNTMSGPMLKVKCTTNQNGVEIYESFLNDVKKWMSDNNYYKGQKIGADGKFLNVSAYNWDDIILEPDVKDSIFNDVVGFLNHANLYKVNDLPFKRGLILYGKPGCGKTLFGKVVANQVNSSFIWVTAAQASSPEFIKELFSLAREIAPTVLFFEDIDMYTVDRTYGSFNAKVGELLAQMDGMEENNGMITIATTNQLGVIEKALAERPSRFDRRYCLDFMSLDTTKQMVNKKLGNANLVDVTLDEVAQLVNGLNGSFIQEVIVSAKRKAISRGNVDENGVVNIDKDIMQESANEVAQSFRLQQGNMINIVASGDLEKCCDDIPCTGWAKEDENKVVMSLNETDKVALATARMPRNVNLTQAEKNEIDGEVNAALSAIAKFSEYNDESAIEEYISDKKLDDCAVSIAAVPFDSIDWKKLDKTNLRKIFRILIFRKNVSKISGKGKDKLADKKLLGSILHAMDMLSDRYYWVHAYARIATNFGLKAEIPFNPYKDQTSKDAALKVYAQITGKIQTAKKTEDKINEENGVFVPPVEDHSLPDYEFNQPKDKDNVTKPWQMK